MPGWCCLPTIPRSWADAIAMLLSSPEKRAAMVKAGYRQAARFSWDETARQTADVYRQVLREWLTLVP